MECDNKDTKKASLKKTQHEYGLLYTTTYDPNIIVMDTVMIVNSSMSTLK